MAAFREYRAQGYSRSGWTCVDAAVRPTLGISCEAPIWPGFVSFNSLFGTVYAPATLAREAVMRSASAAMRRMGEE
jgi:hypothetical protein